jgi:hypothetical protein
MLYEGCVDAGRAHALTMGGRRRCTLKKNPRGPSAVWFDRGAVALAVCSAERLVHVEFHPQAVSSGTLRGKALPKGLHAAP